MMIYESGGGAKRKCATSLVHPECLQRDRIGETLQWVLKMPQPRSKPTYTMDILLFKEYLKLVSLYTTNCEN